MALIQEIKFQEHLVIVIAPVHDKGGFPKERIAGLYSWKVMSFMEVKFFSGRMDFGEDVYRMPAVLKNTGFRNMMALFINIFELVLLKPSLTSPEVFRKRSSGLTMSESLIKMTGSEGAIERTRVR